MDPAEVLKPPEQATNPRNAKEAYQKILKLDHFPKTPEELPQTIFIPPEALGDLEQAIIDTNTGEELERSQAIGFDAEKGFVPSKLFLGNNASTGYRSELRSILRSLFGKKGFITYHTHPSGIIRHSPADLRISRMRQRESFVDLVGSAYGVAALLQTVKTASFPFYAREKGEVLESKYDELLEKIEKNLRASRLLTSESDKILSDFVRELAQLMEAEGYGYYAWLSDTGQVKKGDLNKGLKLERVLGNEGLIKSLATKV